MAKYENGAPKHNLVGKQVIKVNIVSGTVQIQWQFGDEGFNDISEGLFDAIGDTSREITLPECDVQFIISGTATVFMVDSQ